MRIFISVLLGILSMKIHGQQTVITTNSIPLGIKVRKPEYVKKGDTKSLFVDDGTESVEFFDIAELCDGFNDYGIPQRLVVPIGAQIIIFLPNVTKNSTDIYSFYDKDTQKDKVNNFNFVYKGKNVGFLGARLQSPGTRESINIYQQEKSTNNQKARLRFSYRVDEYEPRILGVRGGVEIDLIVQQYKDLAQYEQREYALWLEKGYTDSIDAEGLPYEPQIPHSSHLTFRTSALSHRSIVRLFNIDNRSWYELTPWEHNSTIYPLNRLKAGRYQFVIEDPEKKYGKKITSYTFTVLPSPWNQPIYWLAGVIVLLLISLVSYRFITKRRLRKLDMVKKLTEAELKAIRAQLNPHFLFNALNAIQNLVNKESTEAANDYIAKLSRLMRLVLNQSDESFHTLAKEVEIAKLYLEVEQLRSPFQLEIEVDPSLDQNMLIPSMILQPYLENAVIHGVLNNNATNIRLEIKMDNDICTFLIADNGKGSGSNSGNKKGMKMGADRLAIISRQLNIETQVKAGPSASGGYEVAIQIPLNL